MSKYRMEDGKVLDTDKASAEWEEAIDWNGRNFVSRPTGSQWEHETLYRSSKGRYYIERTSQRQGSKPHAELVANKGLYYAMWRQQVGEGRVAVVV